jgi:hypothetical protein
VSISRVSSAVVVVVMTHSAQSDVIAQVAEIARLELLVWCAAGATDAERDAAARRLWWAYVSRDTGRV